MKWVSRAILALIGILLAGQPVGAQVGSTTDILTGTVTNDQGQPVAEAIVEAYSLDTRVTRTTKTDPRGRYRILFPDGGGQYRLTVRFIGLLPVQHTISRQADEDRIVFDVKLSASPQRLQDIVVRGRPSRPANPTAPTPGSTERPLNPDQVARLPIDASDLNLLATLAPGVVNVAGTDSSGQGFSVAGQRPTANAITLDGVAFGSGSVPQDAIRSTRVITNSYDASRGQFSGGQIATTTRSGTNVVQGSSNYNLRDRAFTVSADPGNPFTTGFTQHQLSFGLGGPLKKDKLFVFGSAQGRFRADDIQSLLNAPRSSLERLGVSPDSVIRFLDVVTSEGVISSLGTDEDSRATDDLSSILRVDYNLTQEHTLTFRGDYRHNSTDPTRIGPLSLPTTGGRSKNSSGGGMVTLSSRLGAVINELRAYRAGSSQEASIFTRLPQGRVQVASVLDDGSQGVANLTFGGNPGLPQSTSNRTLELADEVSWIPGDGAHRIKLGLTFSGARSEQDASFNRYGTFTFQSLADLEAGRPASFTRTLSPTLRATKSNNAALYVADNWRISRQLQVTYGGRIERTTFGGEPALNADVNQLFSRRTDLWPSETHVSPRMGFTWIVGGLDPQTPPKLFIRGGLGEFRSLVPTSLIAAAQAAPGFSDAEAQLVCIGAAAPTPDWSAYRIDVDALPTACAAGVPSPVPTRNPTVTVFAPGFTAPRAWRASLGATRRFGLYSVGAELSWARGVSQSGFTDLNRGGPQFFLPSEAGRPVFVPAATIDAVTGSTGLFGSRKYPDFGQVLEIDSRLGSKTAQMTLNVNGITRKGALLNLSYTLMRARDQSSGSQFGGAQRGLASQTVGFDPDLREYATSDFERRHSFLATVTWPIGESLELTSIGRLTSGTPYTPLVSGDINGDGAVNDRAFIFGAAGAPDSAIGNGMSRLLAGTSGSVRDCLLRQSGAIAGRNTCRGPWQPSLDLQINFRPEWFSLKRRLNISLVTSNLLAGLDEAFHGSNNLKGWGQFTRPDPTLLYVRGFDPTSARYLYTVNERFGASATNTNAIRQPFQIGLQMRLTIGPDRQREMLQNLRGGGAGGFLSRLESMMPNPLKEILDIRIALRLEDAQVDRLKAVADSFDLKTKELAEKVRKEVEKAGANPDPARLFSTIRPAIEEAQATSTAALKSAEAILTPEQWSQVPDRVKNPPRFGPGGGRQGGRGQRPPQ